jgi:hypothetical protein
VAGLRINVVLPDGNEIGFGGVGPWAQASG